MYSCADCILTIERHCSRIMYIRSHELSSVIHITCIMYKACHQDKTPYPPNTHVMLIAGIKRHLWENGQADLAIMSDKDAQFARTRAALDARMKQLTKQGVGTVRKQAQPLSRKQEDTLWMKGIFCRNTRWGLTFALLWYNCNLLGLHGGDEHHSLQWHGQFLRFQIWYVHIML